jgi:hypothetical protein
MGSSPGFVETHDAAVREKAETLMEGWAAYAILFGSGCVAGVLNVVAGGGSFLTLPILIFLGLPAVVANGTNRLGIVVQSIGAVWGFRQYGLFDWRSWLWASVPAAVGSVAGTWGALVISDEAFKKVLAILMVIVTLWTLWNPLAHRPSGSAPARSLDGPALGMAFFLIGIYGGFVQAGVGFLILAVTTIAGFDLIRGNAVKALCVLLFTGISLAIFVWQGKVHWPMGLSLAAGTLLGGLLGVRLMVLKGQAWVKGVVTATVLLFAVLLWIER